MAQSFSLQVFGFSERKAKADGWDLNEPRNNTLHV